jgi:hypothetical protein
VLFHRRDDFQELITRAAGARSITDREFEIQLLSSG